MQPQRLRNRLHNFGYLTVFYYFCRVIEKRGKMNRKERYEYLLQYFREQQPMVQTELEFGSVFQLLVAVMLSAQCTDKRINQVTPGLFARFPDARTMAGASTEELLELMGSVSYPNSKAEHLKAMSERLLEAYGGEVPSTMDELLTLPGVGRKTANVMLSVAFGQPSMAVDTHVFRVSHRLQLVSKHADTPLKVELELVKNIPVEDVPRAHHWLLLHGRYICTARRPHCERCPFNGVCPSASAYLSSCDDGSATRP